MKTSFIQSIAQNLFYLFIFTLPWSPVWIIRETFINHEKWQWVTQGIYLFEIVGFLWILITFQQLGWKKYLQFLRKTWQQSFSFKFLTLFVLWSNLSIFWSSYPELAFYYSLIWLFSGWFLVSLIIFPYPLNITKTIFIFTLSMSGEAFLALQQFFLQDIIPNKWLGISQHSLDYGGTAKIALGNGEKWLRAYGGFPHPNILGGFLAISLLGTIALFLKTVSPKKKFILLFFTALQLGALLFTFSRSAWLAFLIAFSLLSLLTYYYFSAQIKLFLFLASGLLCLVFFSLFFTSLSLFSSRFHFQSPTEKQFLQERILYQRQALSLIKQHPVQGIGSHNFVPYVYSSKKSSSSVWHYQPVHNIYLLITSELGLISLFLWLGFLISLFKEIFIYLKKIKNNFNLIILGLFLTEMLVIAFFDHWLWTQVNGWLLFIVITGFTIRLSISWSHKSPEKF